MAFEPDTTAPRIDALTAAGYPRQANPITVVRSSPNCGRAGMGSPAMKYRIVGLSAALALLFVACAPAAPTAPAPAKPTDVPKPAAQPTTAPTARPATTAPAKPAAAAPTTAPTAQAAAKPAAPALTATEWDQIVAAAKREGNVSVIGPQGGASRDALSAGFNRMYPEIQVEYNGLAGAQTGPKVLTELAAKQNTTD